MYEDREHYVAIVSFEGAVRREMKQVRERLRKLERLPEFHLSVTVSGRVHDGHVKLQYRLGRQAYDDGGTITKGDSLNAVVEEFLRREGWSEVHAPKALTYDAIPGDDGPGAPANDNDGIPF